MRGIIASQSTAFVWWILFFSSILFCNYCFAGGSYYIYNGAQKVGKVDEAGNIHYYVSDHLGSSRVILKEDQTVEWSSDYQPYGREVNVQATGAAEAKTFSGKEHDQTGLYYFGARYYDPVTGRFTSKDPKGQFVSPYIYCANNPLNRIDPTGKFSFPFFFPPIVSETDALAWQLQNQLSPAGLFDLNDPVVSQLYRDSLRNVNPYVMSRDETSRIEIHMTVKDHLQKYNGRALIIIDGAATHIRGAADDLQAQGVRYIPTTFLKLNIAVLSEDKDDDPKGSIQVQLDREIGVVKMLGYASPAEFFLSHMYPGNAKHIMIGNEETGHHYLYSHDLFYKTLTEFLLQNPDQFSSILYIRENLVIKYVRMDFDNNRLRVPSDFFLNKAKNMGIPVEFGAFGHLNVQKRSKDDIGSGQQREFWK